MSGWPSRSIAWALAWLTGAALADGAPPLRMTTPIPARITTPAQVDSSIGKLGFTDGVPTPDTAGRVYDPQTRSMLQPDQQFPSLSSAHGLKANADGTTDIFFAPKRPKDAANWIQTVPGKSWFLIFRLYGPLQPWFDKSWSLEDIQPVG
ncbi:DUF1214 domain-containing protein [Dyella solisilvae]|nr:DUF1214 domain-containing protein [Dyella solisilvae]